MRGIFRSRAISRSSRGSSTLEYASITGFLIVVVFFAVDATIYPISDLAEYTARSLPGAPQEEIAASDPEEIVSKPGPEDPATVPLPEETEEEDEPEALRRACTGGGYISNASFSAGSHNVFGEGYCVHGAGGISIGSHNVAEPGATLGMRDLAMFSQGSDNTGVDEALTEGDINLDLSLRVPSVLSAMRSVSIASAGLPDFITDGPIYLDKLKPSDKYRSGTFYIVNGTASFKSGVLINQIAIFAAGGISVGAKAVLDDVIMATPKSISFAAETEFGSEQDATLVGLGNACLDGYYNAVLVADEGLSFGAKSELRGVQVASRGNISMGAQDVSGHGVYVESLGKISHGSQGSLTQCSSGLQSRFSATAWQD